MDKKYSKFLVKKSKFNPAQADTATRTAHHPRADRPRYISSRTILFYSKKKYFFLFSQVQSDPAHSRMFRNPRRAALLLAAGAAAAGAGRLHDRGDSATVVTVSASAPLRHLLSTAATGFFSSNPLLAPWQGSVSDASSACLG